MILRLLDGEPERFQQGTVITAYTLVDGRNQQVSGHTTKEDAEKAKTRAEKLYPKQTFHVV